MTELTSKTEIEDFVRGCTLMGTGGGGSPEDGDKWLSKLLDEGKTLRWVDADEVSGDAWTVCAYLMGSIAPKTEETKQRMKNLGLTEEVVDNMPAQAARELSDYMDMDVGGVVPIELGGGATPGALSAAALLGVPMVNGDYSGRAIPEVPQTTPIINEEPMWPLASADAYGDVVIIKDSVSYDMAERIGKLVSSASFELVGNAAFPLKGETMQKTVIRGTADKCLELGRAIREARENGKDPVEAALEQTGGWLLSKGEVTDKDVDDREGYYWGTHTITGDGEFAGEEFKIWFKNENHVTWKNDEPFVTSPDIIAVLNRETGEPETNPSIEVGDQVAVIGVEAVDQFTTEKGVEILGPRHFDFDIDHKPISELMD